MSEAGPSATVSNRVETPKEPQRLAKQELLQMIQQKKNQVYALPKEKKLVKLAIHSHCQEAICKCSGWKVVEKALAQVIASDPCHTCGHSLAQHTTHLLGLSEEERNRLLSMVVDAESIFNRIHREQDNETKTIYYKLYKVLKTSIARLIRPLADDMYGTPPFETPTIAMGVLNFVCYKSSHLAEKEWHVMYNSAQMFLHYLNHYTFESPALRAQSCLPEELAIYRQNYSRWMVFCYVPTYCNSFKHFDVSVIFGITVLRSLFRSLKKELMDKLHLSKERGTDERVNILSHFPRFLDLIEEEIYSSVSPVWDEDFKAPPTPHLRASIERIKQLELEKQRAGSAKQAAAESDVQLSTPSSRKNGKDGSDCGKSADGEAKRAMENPDDISLSIIREIVTDLELEKKSTNRSIDDLFETTPLERVKLAEERGQIKVVLLSNSLTAPVTKQTMLWLLSLRTLFLSQLTNMPVNYITRLLYDPKHKTLAIIKDHKPVAGICFRSFVSQGFSEVVFCAVQTNDHYKGYGAHMMNRLKEHHIKINIHHLLTFADKDAVGYFQKQGFSRNVSLDPSVYEGFIKYYDSAMFMHCKIDPRIVYTELCSVLKLQKEVLKRLIDEKKDTVEKIHPGLTCFKEGLKRSIPIEAIPGIRETTWKPAMRPTRVSKLQEETSHPESLNKSLKIVLNVIKNHRLAWPFQEPVKKEDAPDYYDRIKYPMDLKTMSDRLKAGYYTTRRIFIADMLRIFNNCRIYNRHDTEYYKCATDLDRYFQTKMKEMNLWDK